MNWEAIGAIGELIGALAVLITLVYLAAQVKQNTLALKSAAAQTVHENFAHWYSSVQNDPQLLDISTKGMRDYSSLTETERSQFIALFMTLSSYTQNAFVKWREGSLSPELWRGWEYISMNFYSTPGGKDFWNERGYLFADIFQSYMKDDLMKRSPHPNAKPWGSTDVMKPANDVEIPG